jgi:hypothetical protein
MFTTPRLKPYPSSPEGKVRGWYCLSVSKYCTEMLSWAQISPPNQFLTCWLGGVATS